MEDPTKKQDIVDPDVEQGGQPRNPDPRQQDDPQDETRRRPNPIRDEQDDLQKDRKSA